MAMHRSWRDSMIPTTVVSPIAEQKNTANALLIGLLAAACSFTIAAQRQLPPAASGELLEHERAAKRHIAMLGSEPRPTGSRHHRESREYILRTLASYDIPAEVHETTIIPEAGLGGRVANITARVDGIARDRCVLLIAHYDSTPASPGAADDALGTAVVMEALAAFKTGPQQQFSVVGLFTDGEEAGLLGIQAFVKDQLARYHVVQAVNVEARGSDGPALLFELGLQSGATVEMLAETWRRPRSSSIYPALYDLLPYGTDFSLLRLAGVNGINLANIDRSWSYHVALDTPQVLSDGTVRHHLDAVLSAARRFAAGPGSGRADDSVFFDLFGTWLVHYSNRMAAVLTVASTLGIGVLLFFRLKNTWRQFALAVARETIVVLVIVTATAGALPPLLLGAGLMPPRSIPMISAAAGLLLFALADRLWRARRTAIPPGAVIWLAASLCAMLWLPAASYVLTWPLIGAMLVSAVRPASSQTEHLLVKCLQMVPLVIAAVLLTPIVYWLTVTDPTLGSIAAAVAFALTACLVPSLRSSIPIAAATLVAATVGAIVFMAGEPPGRVGSSLAYLYEPHSGSSAWLTGRRPIAEWDQALFRDPVQIESLRSQPVLANLRAARADTVMLAAPRIVLVSHSADETSRTAKFRLVPAGEGGTFFLSAQAVTTAAIDGAAVPVDSTRTGVDALWGLRFVGVPADGIEAVLSFPTGITPVLYVMELTPGLPAALMVSSGRPADVISGPGIVSGCTLVAARYALTALAAPPTLRPQ